MKKKSAWLVAWEGSEQRLARIAGPRILAFVDARKGVGAIREMIFAIYLAAGSLMPEEKLYYSLTVEGRRILRRDDTSCLRCGLNPYVTARLVDDIEVEKREDGARVVRWKQPIYRLIGNEYEFSHFVDREEVVAT